MNLKKLLSFEQGRIKFFETLTKHPENWQQNPTPLPIIRKMVDKTSLDDKKILVLFNIEFLQVLVEERKINPENIYYIADNELEFLGANKIFKVQSYKLDDFTVPALKKLVTGIDMKFDLVFSNPPYNSNIDIKIISELMDCSKEFVIVHPSTWLLDLKDKKKLYLDFKKKIETKCKSFDLFNGNNVFNIQLFVPCVISHISQNHIGNVEISYFDENFSAENLSQVTKYGSAWVLYVEKFMEKISSFIEKNNGSLWSHIVDANFENKDKFYVQFAEIRGTPNRSKNSNDMVLDDFYTMVMKNSDDNKGIRKTTIPPTFVFDSEIEVENFINYAKSDFARFCLSIYKNASQLSRGELEIVPWLDFTEEWDDEKLFEKFEVSQELQDYIREFLPDFHGIRK